MGHNEDDESVGFGRPPKSGRFKPGQSGNPRGKKSRKTYKNSNPPHQSVADDVMEELGETLTVRENGRERKISKSKAFAIAVVNNAIKGDARAISAIVALARNFAASFTEDNSFQDEDVADELEDLDILEDFVARERARLARQKKDVATESPKSSDTNTGDTQSETSSRDS